MTGPSVVGIVGSGPAAEAVAGAVADLDAAAEAIDASAAGSVDLAVVVAPSGRSTFDQVNGAAAGQWIAVELGGIGGRPVADLDAAVSVLDPAGGCFDCLQSRVRSNAEGAPSTEPRTTRSDARLAGAVAGRLVADVLGEEADGAPRSADALGQGASGRVIELPYAERRLLPVPGCRCARSISRGLARTDDDAPLEEAVNRSEAAVDARIGLVREVGEAHSFPAPYYLATLCDTTTFSDAEAGPRAAGVAADWNAAFVKAVGEALERYGAGVYRESSFEAAPADGLEGAVPPSSFVLPPTYDDPDPSEPIAWMPGESIHDGRDVRLPAEFVVFPPPARRHAPSITTGLGLGTSGVGALLSGLYEAIERDATMLSWYSTYEPLGLSVDDDVFETLAGRARAEDLAVTTLLVTQDVDVPVVSVAVHREGEWPRFAVGSGADLDPAGAARSALSEAVQNWMELRAMGRERAAEDPSDIARFAELPTEARTLLEPETTVDAVGLGPDEPTAGRDELDAVLARVEDVGLEAFAARLTPPDVERLGFEVVRVLVPGAQPLFTGERFFGERASAVPRELGFRPRLDRGPHPYP